MNPTFELWDVEAGNVIGSFATAEDGLEIVRTLLATYGRSYANDLSLSRREGAGAAPVVAEGEQLVTMVERTNRRSPMAKTLTPSD